LCPKSLAPNIIVYSQHSPYPISFPKLLKAKGHTTFCGEKSLQDDLVPATVSVLEHVEGGGGEKL